MESENAERVSDEAETEAETVAENMPEGKGRGRFMDTAPADIPEAIVRKLARIAGLEYVERHKREGGGRKVLGHGKAVCMATRVLMLARSGSQVPCQPAPLDRKPAF